MDWFPIQGVFILFVFVFWIYHIPGNDEAVAERVLENWILRPTVGTSINFERVQILYSTMCMCMQAAAVRTALFTYSHM